MQEIWHLSYHYISLPGETPGGPFCSLERFKQQLDFLKKEKYTVLSLLDWADCMRHGSVLPENVATLSFDDNLRDGYARAFPLLKQYGFSATFFAITSTFFGKIPPVIKIQMLAAKMGGAELESALAKRLEGSAYATLLDNKLYDTSKFKLGEPYADRRRVYWVFCHILPLSLQVDLADELFKEIFGSGKEGEYNKQMFIQPTEMQEMLGNDMEIGSHTVNHPLLSTCGLSDVEAELAESQRQIVELFGKRPNVFGWPFGGFFSIKLKSLVTKHYSCAYNYINDSKPIATCDAYDIARLNEANAEIFNHLSPSKL